MSEVTVQQLAETVGIPVDRLLLQLDEAGLAVSGPNATISDEDKAHLLKHLRHDDVETDASAPKKITLKRKTVSELKQAGGGTKAKTISVEVRKRRTYVKRSIAVAEEKAVLDS